MDDLAEILIIQLNVVVQFFQRILCIRFPDGIQKKFQEMTEGSLRFIFDGLRIKYLSGLKQFHPLH